MSSKKRIALVVSHPIQHFCPQYASFAKHADIDFKVFFASSMGLEKYIDPNFKREISWGNLNLEAFEHEFLNNHAVLPSDEDLDAPELEATLANFNPDVVVIYGYFQKLSRRAHGWASSNGVKLAYISDSELRHKQNWFKSALKRIWLYRYFSVIDFFLSVGDANEEFYRHHGVPSSRFVRMHFSIDKNLYDACYKNRNELNNAIREQYGIAKDRCVTSVVGKLVPWKNQDHLIDALQLLENQGKQVDAFLVGSGDMEAAWTRKAEVLKSNRVYMTGFINIETLPSYYAASDFYTHPASKEPHSIAISEAIAMGTPVICSDTCGSYGATDDVQVGKNGLVFPFGDMPALAAAMSELASNHDRRKQMGIESRSISEAFQHQSHRGVVDRLLERLN